MLSTLTTAAVVVAAGIAGYFTRDKYIENHAVPELKRDMGNFVIFSTPAYALGLFGVFLASTTLAPWATTANIILWCGLSFDVGYLLGALGHWSPYTK